MLKRNYDTLVIGAGISGLYAAYKLKKAGLKVLVLEARARSGGRINGLLGADMLHGVSAPLKQLLRPKTDLIKHDFQPRRISNGQLYTLQGFLTAEREIFAKLPKHGDADLSFRDFLKKQKISLRGRLGQGLIGYVQGYHAADISKISCIGLGEIENQSVPGGPQGGWRLRAGYDPIIRRLSRFLKSELRLSHPVSRVVWRPGHVEVEVEIDGANSPKVFVAKTVLLTVPPPLLLRKQRSGTIAFEPNLPQAWRQGLRKIPMGDAAKVVIPMSVKFWKSVPGGWSMLFDDRRGALIRVWWRRGTTLIGWVGAKHAKGFFQRSTPTWERKVEKCVAQLFSKNHNWVRRHRGEIKFHDWRNDLWSQGAYPYLSVHGTRAVRDLRLGHQKTLYYAGDGVDLGPFLGTVNASVIASDRAVGQIKKVLTKNLRARIET